MDAAVRLHRTARLADLEREGDLVEARHHAAARKGPELAALASGGLVGRHLLGDVREALASVDPRARLESLRLRVVAREQHVARADLLLARVVGDAHLVGALHALGLLREQRLRLLGRHRNVFPQRGLARGRHAQRQLGVVAQDLVAHVTVGNAHRRRHEAREVAQQHVAPVLRPVLAPEAGAVDVALRDLAVVLAVAHEAALEVLLQRGVRDGEPQRLGFLRHQIAAQQRRPGLLVDQLAELLRIDALLLVLLERLLVLLAEELEDVARDLLAVHLRDHVAPVPLAGLRARPEEEDERPQHREQQRVANPDPGPAHVESPVQFGEAALFRAAPTTPNLRGESLPRRIAAGRKEHPKPAINSTLMPSAYRSASGLSTDRERAKRAAR